MYVREYGASIVSDVLFVHFNAYFYNLALYTISIHLNGDTLRASS